VKIRKNVYLLVILDDGLKSDGSVFETIIFVVWVREDNDIV
jgi:hypothetical protein